MENKKTKKLLLFLLVIGLALLVIGGTKLTKVFVSTFGNKEVASNYEEKELSGVVNQMYITVLDEDAKVVATTNPDTVVDPDYVFTDTQAPVKKVKFDGAYLVLLEVSDTDSPENKTLLEDNVVYTMTLPDYMVSYKGYDVDITDDCYGFFSENAVTACGGVYDDNVVKMMFNNTKDKFDIVFDYQFFVTFADGLRDTDFDIKTFDFGKFGSLQLYFEEAHPVITPQTYAGTKYSLSIAQPGYATSTNNYRTWEVNLSDVNDDDDYNGYLEIAISDNMGIPIDKRTAYENLNVYLDGVALQKKYGDTVDGCFGNATNDCLITLTSVEDANIFVNAGTQQGELLKKLKFEWASPITATNIKVEFNTKAVTTYSSGSSSSTYVVSADYYDLNEPLALYGSSKSVVVNHSNPTHSLSVAAITGNAQTNELPDGLKYTYTLNPSTKNYVTLDVYPNDYNNMQVYYYMNSKGFLATSDDTTDSFTVKINDEDVTFERVDNLNLSSLANEQLTKADPALQRQMSIIDSYSDNKSGNYRNILKSTTTNADGEYYYLVIGKNTVSVATNYSSNNTFAGSETNNELPSPGSWKIYLFNINNAKVTLEWEQYLEKVQYNLNSNSTREIDARVYINGYSSTAAYYTNRLSNPLIIHSEHLNEFIKYDVVVDTNLLKLDSDNIDNFNFKAYLPYGQSVVSGKYYDVETNRIVDSLDPAKEQYETNRVLMCDQETDSQIDKCAHYVQFGDGSTTLTSGAGSPAFSWSNYSTSYYLSANNVSVDSDGLVHLVFFSKFNYDFQEDQYYAMNEAFIQVMLDAPVNKFEDESGFGTDNKLRYKLGAITAFPLEYFEMTQLSEGYSGNGNSFEARERYFNGEVRFTNDFVGSHEGYSIWDYLYTSNCGTDLTNIRFCSGRALFNGIFRTYIGYETSPIPSQMTAIKFIVDQGYDTEKTININPLTFVAVTDGDDTYDYCDTASGICVHIIDRNDDGMKSGYFVEVSGLKEAKSLDIDYNEYVDTYNLLSENWGDGVYQSDLYAEPFRFGNTFNYNYTKLKRTIYAVSDLAVQTSLSTYVPIDGGMSISIADIIKSHKSSTEYLESEGYLKQVKNVTLMDEEGTSISIDDFKPYLSIDEFVINGVTNTGENINIYKDGAFTSDWAGSTLTLLGTGDNLYELHLEHTSGTIEPIEVFVNYKLITDISIRNAAFYAGEKIGIATNTKAVKHFTCASCTQDEEDDKGNGYDVTNQELYVHAYAEQSELVPYFDGSIVAKAANGANSFTVTYTAGDAGIDGPTDMEISDAVNTSDNYGNSTSTFVNLRSLYPKYSRYTNVVLHYGDQNIELPLQTGTFTVNGETGTITYSDTALSFNLDLPTETYKDTITVTYDIETDYSSLYAEAIEKGWLNTNGKPYGYNYSYYPQYQYMITNTVTDINTGKSASSEGGSAIQITDVVPLLTKSTSSISREEKKWNITFNTGKTDDPVTIQDTMSIQEDGKEEFFNALKNKDLVIKVAGSTIYANGSFYSGWDGTVDIQPNGLNYTFVFKDTDTNKWLSNNYTVNISYNTYIDYTLLGGDTRVVNFHLENKADLTKGINRTDSTAVSYYNYEYTYSISKAFLDNGDDLTETNWKISVSSDNKRILNVNLVDTNTLGDEFGDYLSLTKFRIVLVNTMTNESTVLYDSANSTENPDGIVLGMDDVAGLVFNTNGKYNFFANIAELPANSRMEFYYTLKVDKAAYLAAEMPLDKQLVIYNKVQDNNNKSATATGSSKIPSELTKRYVSEGRDADGHEVLRWTIDVNLADYYDLESLVGKDIFVTDVLSSVFELQPATVTIRQLNIRPSGNTVGGLVNPEYYTLTTENNTVRIQLTNPVATPTIQISFKTKVIGSTHLVHNTVEIDVDNHKTTTGLVSSVSIYSPTVFGVVYSRDMLSYTFYAKKLVDNEVSDEVFRFKITEVDSSGNDVPDGYTATSTNGAEGRIEFNGLRYSRVGTYYYKVEELMDDEPKYDYDKNTYTIKVVVVGSDDGTTFEVQSAEVLGADEIVFHNKTPQPPAEEGPKNPNTAVFVGSIVALLVVISFFIFKKFYKKVNFLK